MGVIKFLEPHIPRANQFFPIPFVESIVCFLVEKIEDYISTNTPDPFQRINISLEVKDIIEVDENRQTITILYKIILEWFDHRLDVKRSEKEIEKYVILKKFG